MAPVPSFVVAPLAIAALLVLARLTRRWPGLRPLVGPYLLTALAAMAMALLGQPLLPPRGWLALSVLVPLLVLAVRGAVLAFEALFRRSQGEAPPALLASVAAVLLYLVGAGVIATRVLGFEITPFLATSAVVGAVVGLALQETLGNLFAGIALHSEAPFQVGDWVRLGTSEGRVEQVSWRAMRLRTWDGDTLTIPNNDVARHAILNFSQPPEPHSRLLQIGVSYHTPPDQVVSVLRSLLDQVPELAPEREPVIRVIGYGDHAIQYEIRYFVRAYQDYRAAENEVNRLIWYHFRRHGIEIPFPVRNVYLRHADGTGEARETPASRLERALRGIDLFRPLSDEELGLAASRFRHLHYAAGEKLIEEGAPGDSFFVIDRGHVQVGKLLGGERRPLARLMEGQFFGEMALLTGEPRSATVVAVGEVDVFTIDKAGFHEILARNPAIAVDISTILAERREALTQAEGDVTARYAGASSPGELKQRILDRIRAYFGL